MRPPSQVESHNFKVHPKGAEDPTELTGLHSCEVFLCILWVMAHSCEIFLCILCGVGHPFGVSLSYAHPVIDGRDQRVSKRQREG